MILTNDKLLKQLKQFDDTFVTLIVGGNEYLIDEIFVDSKGCIKIKGLIDESIKERWKGC